MTNGRAADASSQNINSKAVTDGGQTLSCPDRQPLLSPGSAPRSVTLARKYRSCVSENQLCQQYFFPKLLGG
jgi:hypothetical protein